MKTFRTAYGPRADVPGLECKDRSRTKQSHKQECDINSIVRQFENTGMIEHRREYEGSYAEFEEFDFHEAMNIVAAATEMFETVPAKIRKRFSNDPAEFLDFVQKPENREQMYEMGLAVRPEPETRKAAPEMGLPIEEPAPQA